MKTLKKNNLVLCSSIAAFSLVAFLIDNYSVQNIFIHLDNRIATLLKINSQIVTFTFLSVPSGFTLWLIGYYVLPAIILTLSRKNGCHEAAIQTTYMKISCICLIFIFIPQSFEYGTIEGELFSVIKSASISFLMYPIRAILAYAMAILKIIIIFFSSPLFSVISAPIAVVFVLLGLLAPIWILFSSINKS